MSYLGVPPFGQTVRTTTELTATAAQTTFTPAGGYLPGYIDVFMNGVLLDSSDYTATNGSTVVLAAAAALDDEIKTIAYWPVSMVDTYRKSEVDSGFLPAVNPSYTGTLTGGTGVVNLGSGQVYKDASGNVGIGTSSPSGTLSLDSTGTSQSVVDTSGDGSTFSLLQVGGFNGTPSLKREVAFFTNAASGARTERARIDSSGNLLVGKTTNNDTSIGCSILPTDGNTGRFKAVGDNGSSGAAFQALNTSGSSTFLVRPNGNAQNTNNSYGAISDIKLKENIVDATSKLESLNQVRVVNYNLIGSQHKQIGVVAQELEQIFPGMVEESPDEDKDGNRLDSTTKAVKYSVFVPMLIKAIQELKAINDAQAQTIESLTARVVALEGQA